MGRRAGLELGLAGQCAELLLELGWTNQDAALVALERLEERVVGGGVENPVGLFRAILTRPGGPEPSRKAIKRRAAEEKRRAEFDLFIRTITHGQYEKLCRKTCAFVRSRMIPEEAEKLLGITPDQTFFELPWSGSELYEFLYDNWDEIRVQNVTYEAVA